MNTPGMRWLEQACQVGFAQRNERAQLYAFDKLAGDGEDHRHLPLWRKRQFTCVGITNLRDSD